MRFLILTLPIFACGQDDTDTDTAPPQEPSTTSSQELTVLEGTWTTDQLSPTSDACGLYDPSNPEEHVPFTYELSKESGQSFTLEGDRDDWLCTIRGNGFDCDSPSTSQPVGYGLSADLVVSLGLGGVIMGEDRISAEHTIVLECEGVDCSQVITVLGLAIPCTLRGDMQLVHNP